MGPLYRVAPAQDGRWSVMRREWLQLTATSRREVLDDARVGIGEWLEVEPAVFEVEA